MSFYCPTCGGAVQTLGSQCLSCAPVIDLLKAAAPRTTEIVPARPQVGLAPSFPRTQQVASYQHGGVGVVHSYAGNDAQILDQLEATALLLADMAQKIRGFAGLDDETRKLIKSTMSLAADMQNEVDRRKGR